MRVALEDSKFGTLDHIYLSYLADRGESGMHVGWKNVLRDAWFGILIWIGACLIVFFIAGSIWIAIPIGLYLGSALVVTTVRCAMGHAFKCALMYGVHWPLQLGEMI